MKIYQFANVSSIEHRIYLHCTDPQLINSLLEQLKKIVANYKIETQQKNLSGDLCDVTIKVTNDDMQLQVYYWVEEQLLNLGWEPLGDGEFRFSE